MKTRSYLTTEDKEYIIENCKVKHIAQIAEELNVPAGRVHKFITSRHLDFKRVDKQKNGKIFPEGCFNPHERENWLI